ncbi:hypothetical protein KR215_003645 [Drosophila sulfurigaster]|nr:hypothetical protein KR215_003645 [Drosophila sulfurigaster]
MNGSVYLSLLLLIVVVHSERNFQMYLENVTFQNSDQNVFENVFGELVQLKNRTYISGGFTLRRIVSKFAIKASIDLIKTHNQKLRLFNVDVDGCSILNKGTRNSLYDILLKTFRRHSANVLRCPFYPKINYTVQGMYLDENDFSIYVPECKFQGVWDFLSNKKVIIRLLFNGGVKRN